MISVVIPTRNRAGLLSAALESLTRQSLAQSEFEILVVDNASTDDTAASVHAFSKSLPNLRYVREDRLGLHFARHRGLSESRGDILTFTDDDIEALPTWLYSIEDAFSAPDVALVGGNNLPLFTEAPPQWVSCIWKRSTFGRGRAFPPLSILHLPGGARSFNPYFVWGCNFSIRKPVLVVAGGFNPDGMPEHLIQFRGDGETHVSRFIKQAGLKCIFHPGASVFHKVMPERMTYAYFRRRGFNQGISDSFSALRDDHLGYQNRLQRERRWSYRFARSTFRQLKSLLMFGPDARRALSELREGQAEGYEFHQHAFYADPDVRAWVLKESYL